MRTPGLRDEGTRAPEEAGARAGRAAVRRGEPQCSGPQFLPLFSTLPGLPSALGPKFQRGPHGRVRPRDLAGFHFVSLLSPA